MPYSFRIDRPLKCHYFCWWCYRWARMSDILHRGPKTGRNIHILFHFSAKFAIEYPSFHFSIFGLQLSSMFGWKYSKEEIRLASRERKGCENRVCFGNSTRALPPFHRHFFASFELDLLSTYVLSDYELWEICGIHQRYPSICVLWWVSPDDRWKGFWWLLIESTNWRLFARSNIGLVLVVGCNLSVCSNPTNCRFKTLFVIDRICTTQMSLVFIENLFNFLPR